MDLKTASLTKYAINTFLATKVIYFNGSKSFEKLGVADSWEEVTKSILKDKLTGKANECTRT